MAYPSYRPPGRSHDNLHATPLAELKMLGPSRWDVRIAAEDKESGARDSIAFRVSRPKGLDAMMDHRVFPAFAGFRNTLRFRFDGKGSQNDRGEKYRIKITVMSGNGSLSLDPEGSGGKSAFAMEVEADKDHVLYYRWHGPRDLDEPATESILLQIPELELEETVAFSVGVAIEIHSAQQEQLEVEQPGLFVPVKVYVQDKFHPDLDMAEFFRTFLMKPTLVISQADFKPFDPEESMPKLNLAALLDHVRGAGLPRIRFPSSRRRGPSRRMLVHGGSSSPGRCREVLSPERLPGDHPVGLRRLYIQNKHERQRFPWAPGGAVGQRHDLGPSYRSLLHGRQGSRPDPP